MKDFLTFAASMFYPVLAIFATVCLYVIAVSLEKISKNK